MPSPVSGCPNIALSEQIRKSQLIASSLPPPRANPFTAAITGTGKVSILRKRSLPFLPKASPSFLVSLLISPISAPATKLLSPAPVSTSARISSRFTLSITSFRSSRTWLLSALSAWGRLIVIRPTAPSTA